MGANLRLFEGRAMKTGNLASLSLASAARRLRPGLGRLDVDLGGMTVDVSKPSLSARRWKAILCFLQWSLRP